MLLEKNPGGLDISMLNWRLFLTLTKIMLHYNELEYAFLFFTSSKMLLSKDYK
jgi:hypothetical protein